MMLDQVELKRIGASFLLPKFCPIDRILGVKLFVIKSLATSSVFRYSLSYIDLKTYQIMRPISSPSPLQADTSQLQRSLVT